MIAILAKVSQYLIFDYFEVSLFISAGNVHIDVNDKKNGMQIKIAISRMAK